MKIELKNNTTQCEARKRQYLPITLNWTCPKCGHEHTRDLSNDYLFSDGDILNHYRQHWLYCYKCEHEEPIQARMVVQVEIIHNGTTFTS